MLKASMLCFHQPAKPGEPISCWLFAQAFPPKKRGTNSEASARSSSNQIRWKFGTEKDKYNIHWHTYSTQSCKILMERSLFHSIMWVHFLTSLSNNNLPSSHGEPQPRPNSGPNGSVAACGGAGRGTLPRAMVNFKSCLSRHSCEDELPGFIRKNSLLCVCMYVSTYAQARMPACTFYRGKNIIRCAMAWKDGHLTRVGKIHHKNLRCCWKLPIL